MTDPQKKIPLPKLIAELCPDGVEFKSIKEIAEVSTGSSNGNEAIDDGEFPFFVRSQTVKRKNDYEFDEEAIIIPGEGGIGDIYHYVDGKYALHQRVYRIHFINNDINTKFAYYFFASSFKKFILRKAVSATVISIRKPMIEGFSIPIPPMEVQREIVRILDKFTELGALLETELVARKKQYEYYRDKLLTFATDVPRVAIGEIANIIVGGDVPKDRFSKEKTTQFNVPIFSNGVGENALYGFTDKIRVSNPSVTIAARGTIGYCSLHKEPFFPIIRLICVIPHEELYVNFLKHFLDTVKFNVPKSGIPQLTAPTVSDVKIPLPPLHEQKRIADILDRFDALCNDLTSGIPAEIAARKKQYEYYRDRLLTFREKIS